MENETLKTGSSALRAIQGELVAPKNQFNAFGKYKYRSCEDILEALKPLLSKHNAYVKIDDEIVLIGDRYYVKATAFFVVNGVVIEKSTAFARESLDKKGMDDSQITGATSSYARKYALNGLFLIDDTKNADDVNTHNDSPKLENKPSINTPQGIKTALKASISPNKMLKDLQIGGTLSEVSVTCLGVEFKPDIGKSGMSRLLVKDDSGTSLYVKKWGKVAEDINNKKVTLFLVKCSDYKGNKQYECDSVRAVASDNNNELKATSPEELAWEE